MTNISNLCRLSATSLMISSLSLSIAAIPAEAVTLVPPGSTVAGKTIGEWHVEFWKWANSQSVPNDAFTDETGANAGVGQSGPVWFIGGTTDANPADGFVTRSFTVPGDKYLFFPLLNGAFSEAETGGLTGQELIDFVTGILDQVDSAFLEINGVPVIDNSNFSNYREPSPGIFSYVADPDNPGGVPVGDSGDAYADGIVAIVEPLGEGTYTFSYGGGIEAFDFSTRVESTITATPVPEPTSVLSLLALGTLGTVTLKRKQSTK